MGTFRRSVILATLALAATATAADLRTTSDPKMIASAFPSSARVRVLNVWATWCVPCVEEMPDLRALDESFGAEVAIAGVTLDDMIPGAQKEKVASYLDRAKIAFPNVYYTGNPDDLGDHLGFSGEIPITIVYDRGGREVWRHQGRINRQEMAARLREFLRRNR